MTSALRSAWSSPPDGEHDQRGRGRRRAGRRRASPVPRRQRGGCTTSGLHVECDGLARDQFAFDTLVDEVDARSHRCSHGYHLSRWTSTHTPQRTAPSGTGLPLSPGSGRSVASRRTNSSTCYQTGATQLSAIKTQAGSTTQGDRLSVALSTARLRFTGTGANILLPAAAVLRPAAAGGALPAPLAHAGRRGRVARRRRSLRLVGARRPAGAWRISGRMRS